jgi:hypothetical protein
MPLGVKEPNRNYTVYGKFNASSASHHWSSKQRLYLAINKIAGYFTCYAHSIPAGADDLIQRIGRKVIVGNNITT